MVLVMGAVAAPRSSRPAGPVSLAAAALVALAATVILLVSPGPARPAAAPSTPIPDQTGPVAFTSLGATYLSAPADPSSAPGLRRRPERRRPSHHSHVGAAAAGRARRRHRDQADQPHAAPRSGRRSGSQPSRSTCACRRSATLQIDFHFRARGCVTHRPVQVPALRQPLVVGYSAGGKAFAATVRGGYLPHFQLARSADGRGQSRPASMTTAAAASSTLSASVLSTTSYWLGSSCLTSWNRRR